jgi:heat shock protein HslJ
VSWEPLAAGAERTLEAYRWRLDSATDAQGRRIDGVALPDGRAFTFAFPASRVVIDGGCNTMRGGVEVDAGRIRIGRMAATMKACDDALMKADAALAKLLADPLKAAIDGSAEPRLRLETGASETLLLVGHPTPESRYGPATVMFLEVAAQRIPCSMPPMRMATCLQVRDRVYDANGLLVGTPGEWRVRRGDRGVRPPRRRAQRAAGQALRAEQGARRRVAFRLRARPGGRVGGRAALTREPTPQNDPNIVPSTITATSATIAPTIPTITMSK